MQSLLTILREVRDPRDINARHDLASMLFIALAATLCGAKSCVDIADFAGAHEADLAQVVALPYGAPSHDSFSRVFRLLDPGELAAAFAGFARALREGLGLGPAQVVAVDGKRLRRGYERGRAHMPPLLVSVWDAQTRLSLATQAAASGQQAGNEVAMVLAALNGVALQGAIVTADALHCHPAMAEAVRARGADYALKLKGNHAPLLACAVAGFEAADAGGTLDSYELSQRGHGRTECRRASVIACPGSAPAFPGLAALGRIESRRTGAGGRTSHEVHYVALSRHLSPQRMLEVVRGYWSVENHLHRQLDVVFHEDDARTRRDHGPQNLGVIRRMALDILRAHPDTRSIARKMKQAAWNKDFFYGLFTYMR